MLVQLSTRLSFAQKWRCAGPKFADTCKNFRGQRCEIENGEATRKNREEGKKFWLKPRGTARDAVSRCAKTRDFSSLRHSRSYINLSSTLPPPRDIRRRSSRIMKFRCCKSNAPRALAYFPPQRRVTFRLDSSYPPRCDLTMTRLQVTDALLVEFRRTGLTVFANIYSKFLKRAAFIVDTKSIMSIDKWFSWSDQYGPLI